MKAFYPGNLEIEILGINAFCAEFVCKETFTETVSKRETNEAVCCHIFFTKRFSYFLARYMVQMPKVKRFQKTLEKPVRCRIPSITSPCGKASMVAGR